ncbi:hypothetical protein [Vibrio parahaemolyticus]|uniref:hypothetical protein n=1 Tax=Vibrio parahaemolyticus TaxID=670 RepID=UPI001121B5BA|nr:hypothetical protein [Vibrio parahaemolyticus]HCE3715988.1 hypothetical protein [Vibrio parahaemolyticus]HCH1629662.1 hypothetical protein [Vibrio parahaemolyticus]
MAYSLHIEREEVIALEEWVTAIDSIDGLRIASGNSEILNSSTGEEIAIQGNPGDVSIRYVTKGFLGLGERVSWEKAIYFNSGRAQFKFVEGIEQPHHPVHIAVVQIAKKLGASIVGDEGEVYDW